ncbi:MULTISPECIES: hypothetical protein [Nocardiaceae]|uniref:Uncharacterized protein n=1 Tax=Rhodococcoides fascians D188 TaxID=1051973 RepID=G8JYN8_RHOFA|nr:MULTISPECIES: hypothetical protein [Rhodococcus]AET25159.1 hypothetical protein pFi_023 [Rhodococcus fascians D188]AMY56185.1 hypothetical protein A3L23_04887 [Rhodococcus fascians D188]OZC43707.1 hypothetical protein CH289_26245 [Rhodococcus sp. RS1C4]OZC51388.1 hypothetical protein CH267_21335 [Rhodococcus sp. 06-621-2]OZC63177.1 hypothetical protein CH277_23075 [Rhodococcus sp. 06-469-3-2]
MAASRTIANRIAATTATLFALALFSYTRMTERAGGRKSDKGYSMETVVITAGLVILAIAIVAGITVVAQRYLNRIQ